MPILPFSALPAPWLPPGTVVVVTGPIPTSWEEWLEAAREGRVVLAKNVKKES